MNKPNRFTNKKPKKALSLSKNQNPASLSKRGVKLGGVRKWGVLGRW